MNLLINSFASFARSPKKRALLFSMITILIFPAISNAATVYVTASKNWSTINTGCTGGVPCAGDTVIVENGANLTVDVNNAQCANLQLGDNVDAPTGLGILTFAATGVLTVHGVITFGDGTKKGTLDMSAGGTLTCNGFSVVNLNNTNTDLTGGTVILDATNTLPANSSLGTFNNLIINSGTTTLGRITVINSDLTIKGTLDVDPTNSYRLDVKGNWDNAGGTFIEENGTVRFLGSSASAQTINGETFYHLTINNTGGGASLTGNTTVTNILTLTNGNIILGNNNLTVGVAGTISASSATSYVQADSTGVMRKNFDVSWIGTAFTFPIGDASNYSRLSITLNSATFGGGDYITVKVTPTMHAKLNGTGDYIKRYWTINSGGFSAINYNVSYWYVGGDTVGTPANMIQQTWNQSVWVSYGTVVPASNRVNGNNITVIPLNFDLTAAGNGATLPVELLNFDAQFEDGVVKILWTTASETNNDYFTIEKSLDGINFEALTMVPGAGNSNHFISYTAIDKNPLQGTSYYRLKQTDFNGAYEIFEPVVVKNDASGTADSASLTVFPNPSNGQDLSIKLSGFGPNTEVYIVVSDLLGKELYSGKATTNADGFITTPIEQQLASGTYIVAGFANGTVYNKKIIVR